MKKLAWILSVCCIAAALAGCSGGKTSTPMASAPQMAGGNPGNRLSGQVNAIEGSQVTLTLMGMGRGPGEGMPENGQRPEGMEKPKDGEMPSLPEGMEMPEDGEMPQLPEGMEMPEDGEMPSLPEGMEMPKDGEMPQLPEGMENPPQGAAFGTGETQTVDLSGVTITRGMGESGQKAAVEDIAVGDYLLIELAEDGKPVSAAIMEMQEPENK